jgi:hypothetical protein
MVCFVGAGVGAGVGAAEAPNDKVRPAYILLGSVMEGLRDINSWMLFPVFDAIPLKVSPYCIV